MRSNRHILRTACAAALLLATTAAPATVEAQEPEGRRPTEHVVRPGDTLWELARRYLANPFLWTEIFDANRAVVKDPHWIYPAEKLVIPGSGRLAGDLPQPDAVAMPDAGPERSRFFSYSREVRERPTVLTDLERAAVARMEMLAAPWVQPATGLAGVGVVERVADPDSEEQTLDRFGFPFERLHLRYRGGARPVTGDSLLLVSIARSIPEVGEVIEPTALVEVVGLSDEVFTVRTLKQFGLVRPGQLAIAHPPVRSLEGMTAAEVSDGPAGRILSFREDRTLPAQRGIAFLDLASSSVSPGDELVAYVPARVVNGTELPPEPVARLRVLRATPTGSTALITQLMFAEVVPGTPVRVVATMR